MNMYKWGGTGVLFLAHIQGKLVYSTATYNESYVSSSTCITSYVIELLKF